MPQLLAHVVKLSHQTRLAATIRRAQAQARAELQTLLNSEIEQLQRVYARAFNDISLQILAAADGQNTLRLEVLNDLRNAISQRMDGLASEWGRQFGLGLNAAAELGTLPFANAGISNGLVGVAEDSVRFVRNLVAADGLQLSDRVWRVAQHSRDVVVQALENAIIQGRSAHQAALDFLQRGENVPAALARKLGLANADSVVRVLGGELMQADGNPMRNAIRLFRTEMNRANGEAFRASSFAHPDVVGTRFLLSPNHPRFDICDMHANVNRYGLGKGVYPKGGSPWPAHPETMSFEVAVFSDEVTDEDRRGKENRIAWLKRQAAQVQLGALGKGKRAALLAGLLRESQIKTPWATLKARYEKQGVFSNMGAVPPVQTVAAGGSPVSAALNAVGHKRISASVLSIIDSIHGDGALPNIPIRRMSAKPEGYYQFTRGGTAFDIGIRSSSKMKAYVLTHEIGHFIDHQGIGIRGQFASVSDAIFKEWRDAVGSSAGIRALERLRDGPFMIGGMAVPRANIGGYLLDTTEVWARSYAQYIALRSGDKILLSQLDDLIRQSSLGRFGVSDQWAWDDFDPIARAIDKLFKQLGWLI